MKLTDEYGNEYRFVELGDLKPGGGYMAVVPVKPKPKIIDWTKVAGCVPLQDRKTGEPIFMECSYGGGEYSLETGKWVAWFGEKRPLPDGVIVRLLCRDGCTYEGVANSFSWRHRDSHTDIIAFKVTGLADGYCYSEEQ